MSFDLGKYFRRPFKLWRGWIVLICTSLMALITMNSLAGVNALFVLPVMEDLSITQSAFQTYPSIYFLATVITLPLWGKLAAKYSVRKIMFICTIGYALAKVMFGLSQNLLQLYIWGAVGGLLEPGMIFVMSPILFNRWFAKDKGSILGYNGLVLGIAVSLILKPVAMLIELTDWRFTNLMLSVLTVAVGLPCIVFGIRERPEDVGLKPFGFGETTVNKEAASVAPLEPIGPSKQEVIRSSSFWLLCLAFIAFRIAGYGVQSSIPIYMSYSGFTTAFAASIYSVYQFIMSIGKVIIGYMFDRLGIRKTTFVAAIIYPISFASLMLMDTDILPKLLSPWVFAALYGFICSYGYMCTTYLPLVFYGKRDYAEIGSWTTAAYMVGATIGNPLTGIIYDLTHNYQIAWALYLGLVIFGMLIIWRTENKRLKGMLAKPLFPNSRLFAMPSTEASARNSDQ